MIKEISCVESTSEPKIHGNEFGNLHGKATCKLALQTVYDPS